MGKRADREKRNAALLLYCLQLGTLAYLTFSGDQRRGLNITANSVSKVYFSLHFDANGFSDLKA
jgi:hypothetical protein